MSEPKIITKKERLVRKEGCSTCNKPIPSTVQLPTRWDMLKNLVQAAKDAVASGLDVRSPEDTERILKICADCPNLAGDEISPRCGICGCHLKMKVQLSAWHCPVGKW